MYNPWPIRYHAHAIFGPSYLLFYCHELLSQPLSIFYGGLELQHGIGRIYLLRSIGAGAAAAAHNSHARVFQAKL